MLLVNDKYYLICNSADDLIKIGYNTNVNHSREEYLTILQCYLAYFRYIDSMKYKSL